MYDQIDTLASSRLSHIRIDRPKDHPWMEKESCMCGLRSASICYSANQRAILRTHSDFNALEMVQVSHITKIPRNVILSHDFYRVRISAVASSVRDFLTPT